MRYRDDPNPLDAELECGNCGGTVLLGSDDYYRCLSCDFEMSYDDMKECDLFARHLLEHAPDLQQKDWNDIFNREGRNS